ncbi:MAG: 2Fe-2S iron-sulfur cluster-binding protein [Betaproteobacteria bacterium]|jgi:NADH-quinone oxidoreductase subunit G|nr:2Fe-2S iron-sulfur cluster-binding protein [Betaproteobacteria bacterium]
MPEIFVDGVAIEAKDGQTVMEAARDAGIYIPGFCWHPQLSVAGNCRLCMVEVEGDTGGWMDIACNMPATRGMKVLTQSPKVKERRKTMLEMVLLNHPVDCGVCDKAGECMLQDYHYEHNGAASVATVAKHRTTKFHELSKRIVLDNERCVLCSRCVRFTKEVSKSHALGILDRGDHSLVRCDEKRSLDDDPYSDNVVDLCPVGALLSRRFLYKSRVWYLQPTPSVCPGCERGCTVDLWHRKAEWKFNALDPRQNVAIERVTPRENPAVNGPWICNKARDLPDLLERPRGGAPMLKGARVPLAEAAGAARRMIDAASSPVALISSWGSNEELAAARDALGPRFRCFVKADHVPQPGERVGDDFLIRPDKNPNGKRARELFGTAPVSLDGADLVLVWGEGFDFADVPRGAKSILLNAFLAPENGHADAYFPTTLQTERAGHYTNFAGVVSAFAPIRRAPAGSVDAEALFGMLAAVARVPA